MGFEALLGNERLKETLSASLHKGHISHFYLISGPKGSGKHTLAKLLAQAILCEDSHKPCGVCGPCRKLDSGNHPDFITVVDPEHKNVAVKIVREIREDVFIRPNESAYKIYLFPQELGVEGQNALLKILEEPPPYGVFMLLTDNPEKLLTTVRSRCTELKLLALPEKLLHRQLRMDFPQATEEDISSAMARSGGFLGQAKEILTEGGALPPQTEAFVRCFAARDYLGLTQLLAPLEKSKRDPLLELLNGWRGLLEQAFACRTGGAGAGSLARHLAESRSSAELLAAIKVLNKAAEYCQGNVSPGAVCGWLQWNLR
jgi:DNA polymerase-3 subunit delta'